MVLKWIEMVLKWIEMVLKWIEMVHLDTMGEVALFKTRLHQRRLDHEAQERSRTDAQTHREHLKKDLATNFMFGKKICVMHFLHVGYRSLSEL